MKVSDLTPAQRRKLKDAVTEYRWLLAQLDEVMEHLDGKLLRDALGADVAGLINDLDAGEDVPTYAQPVWKAGQFRRIAGRVRQLVQDFDALADLRDAIMGRQPGEGRQWR